MVPRHSGALLLIGGEQSSLHFAHSQAAYSKPGRVLFCDCACFFLAEISQFVPLSYCIWRHFSTFLIECSHLRPVDSCNGLVGSARAASKRASSLRTQWVQAVTACHAIAYHDTTLMQEPQLQCPLQRSDTTQIGWCSVKKRDLETGSCFSKEFIDPGISSWPLQCLEHPLYILTCLTPWHQASTFYQFAATSARGASNVSSSIFYPCSELQCSYRTLGSSSHLLKKGQLWSKPPQKLMEEDKIHHCIGWYTKSLR